jgi:large subunit ribosomal protein L5
MARLKEKYLNEVAPKLRGTLGVNNPMLVPRLLKVTVNMGFGIVEKDELKALLDNLQTITGQKPAPCKARKSISNFKLREGMVIGAKVTLRGERMYEFVDRLISAGLPRLRDFRGVPNRGFDGRGNYTLGLKEQSIFPELAAVELDVEKGMDITFVTNARNNKEARELLAALGMPFAGK